MRVFSKEESTANALSSVGLEASFTAWRDALHVGRVSPLWDLNAFAADRAEVYRELNWDEDHVFLDDMQLRNEEFLEAINSDQELVFVFDPNLGDQLQLCQILAWIATHSPKAVERSRIALLEKALPEYKPSELAELVGEASKLDFDDLELFRSAWLAFISPDPRFLDRFLGQECQSRFESNLKRATNRLLREYPSCENALSLTECQVLDAVRLGVHQPQTLFEACREAEGFPFYNNWELWTVLNRLCSAEQPLVTVESRDRFLCPPKDLAWTDFYEQRLVLTDLGQGILEGSNDTLRGLPFPRWICGVEISEKNPWFWNYATQSLTREPNLLAEV